jgi:hypothetical protein
MRVRVMSFRAALRRLSAARWRRAVGIALAAGVILAGGQGGAGHSVGHYPSYYPDEIRIDVMSPEAAGKGLADQSLHAYVGAAPKLAQPAPSHIKSVKSLGSFWLLSFDKASSRFPTAEARCAAARGVMAALHDAKADGFVFHPYPVTPYHADYLHHLDRIEAIRAALGAANDRAALPRVGARDVRAKAIVEARLGRAVSDRADFVLEEVAVDDLLAAAGVHLNGWSGPPWVKEGWFHAHWLLAPTLGEASRAAVQEVYNRIVHGELRGGLAERADLERRLVADLTGSCSRLVVGYAAREEFVNEAYPPGAENIAFDAIEGLNTPIFVRTAKLKDYPWNGKLHLGVRLPPRSAWNPVAGFTDGLGRLLWAAVGDPAMIAFPFNASWMPNRIQSELTKVEGRSGGIKVPADALRPEPGSGLLQPVGGWAFASAKATYEVLASPFEDGTEQTVGDVLYPYAFLYRWGIRAPGGAPGSAPVSEWAGEPRLAATFAAMEERLVGLKVVRVQETTHNIAEGLTVVTKTPFVEVYLRAAPGDERQVAALAPPWSTVPWHLLVLMEEAVSRGWAAFSAEEAARRGVPWLDVVRDPALKIKLQDLASQFEREAYRPAALRDLVGADEARARWRALGAFAEKNGHFLVANGPYRLKSWTPDGVVLEAVREITYPLGFGAFDRFVYPPKAVIEEVKQDGRSIIVRAGIDMTLKAGRGTMHVKEPLQRTTARGTYPLLVVSRYLLIDAAGKVLKLDKMHWREDGLFTIDLPQGLPPGEHSVTLAIFLDGNTIEPSARTLQIRRIGASGSPG